MSALPRFLAELRARTPLASLVARTVKLVRSGRQMKGCCPFHAEKTPSLHVYPDHFHCFGCGAHGDAVTFVRRTEGGSFADAVERLAAEAALDLPSTWRRSGPSTPAPDHPEQVKRAAQRERQQAERQAAAAREEASRASYAARLWAQAAPIDGTPAERHLTNVRRLSRPAEGWPDSLRWHSGKRAMVAAATRSAGDVPFVQLLALNAEGRPDARARLSKRSHGVQGGAPVRYPGDPTRPLLVAEGVATGLAAWTAMGDYEVHCALGSLWKLRVPHDRLVILLADDDAPWKAAKLESWAAELRASGHRVVLATPSEERRGDGSDFADLLRSAGPDSVRARIAEAIGPIHVPVAEQSLAAVRKVMVDEVRRWLADTGPRHLLVPGEPGSGKSAQAHKLPLAEIARRKAAGDPHRLILFVPDHQLAAESRARLAPLAAQASAAGLTIAVLLGFGDPDKPLTPDSPCQNLPAVMLALSVGQAPKQAVCGPTAGGDRCAHFGGCRRLASHAAAKAADIVIAPTAYAFAAGHLPADIRTNLWRAIVDEDLVAHAISTSRLGLETFTPLPLQRTPVLRDGEPDLESTAELQALQAKLVVTIEGLPDGYLPAQALSDAGLRVDDVRRARALTWARKRPVSMRPGMPLDERRETAASAKINGQLGGIDAVWHAIEDILTGGEAAAGRIRIELETTRDRGQARVLCVLGLKPLAPWLAELPALLLDGTGDIDRVRRLLPDAEKLDVPKIAAPHARTHLVLGSFGASAMASTRKQAKLVTFMTAATAMHDSALLVTHKSAASAFTSPGFDLAVAHHGAVAGRDGYRGVRNVFVTGARSLPPEAAAELAAALTGEAVPIAARTRMTSPVRLRDGSTVLAERMGYADPRTLAAHDAIYFGDMGQAAGRGRGILRTAATPLDTYTFANAAPPGMIFDSVQRWADVRPDCIDEMLQAGIVFDSPTHAALVYRCMFLTPKAAEHRFARAAARTRRRFNLPAGMTTAEVVAWRVEQQAAAWGQSWTRDTYQRSGQGHAPATIHAPVTGMALARKIVVAALGPLAWGNGAGPKEVPPGFPKDTFQEAGGTSRHPAADHGRFVAWHPVPPTYRADRPPDD